ncbi:unnamed protein product [Adineta steineri]|uniref:F-box domain-containing protein n=1 Tax=Adineta steineri TaxID=433720 RepID=A0A814WHR4_9BILA|nr:unnamed protein product [Adineta steineri]CAF1201641.1 unnamed protein product [Adineta steineri]
MEHLSTELNDLPDEILMIILKKLFNTEVLYSLIDVNKRFNTIVRDPIFTNKLTLMRCLSNNRNYPLPDPILDRFCFQILPSIRHKIKWLNLESSSMKRILNVTNYPNLYGLGLYDLEIETARSLIDEFCLTSINKNQILSLIIDVTKYKNGKNLRRDMTECIFMHILNIFSNLEYLNFCPSSMWYQGLLLNNPSPTINSSTLLELHISLASLTDCLYILDGRFNKLHTLYVDIDFISSLRLTNNNQEKLSNLRCFSLCCGMSTDYYDELIVPFLQRMSNLEKLSLNLIVCAKSKFVDGIELKQNIINHMARLKRLEFCISSSISLRNQIYLQSKQDIQDTFKDFKDDEIISYVDYFQEKYTRCHIYLYPEQLKYYGTLTNNFPGENSKPQNNKLCRESQNGIQDFAIINYPYLTTLTLYGAHDDYIEEFLVDTKICLPNNLLHINIYYEQLKRVTHNFTRDATRNNCAKLNSLFLNGRRYPKHAKNYFPNVPKY